MINLARHSKIARMLHMTVLVLFGALGAHAADGAGDEKPETPGVYVKMKTGDERLIALGAEKTFEYKTSAGEKPGGQAVKRYFVGKPGTQVNLSQVEGFFIYGDFDVKSFAITQYTPTKFKKIEVLEGSDTGPGVEKLGTYIDIESGWTLGTTLQAVEVEPKLYWIAVAENLHATSKGASFLAVTFGDGQYFPFVDFNDYQRFVARLALAFKPVFGPPLNAVFHPVNRFLNQFYKPYAMISALTLFIGTMLWVNLILKKDYVNKGRPFKAWYTDLRLWTIISMLPHVLVYFYFNK